jgi:Protein of unknown function with PCYCGC motif
LTRQSRRQFDGHSAWRSAHAALPVCDASRHGRPAPHPDHVGDRQCRNVNSNSAADRGRRLMDAQSARFPRREFLVALAGFGSIGAFAWVALPTMPALVRAASLELPSWATTTPTSAAAYRAAVLNGDLLTSIPCFCGCVGYQPPHRSLRDCFLRPEGGFEAHAAGCTTCQEEALMVSRLARQGMPAGEMHNMIVAAFSERGPSTEMAASV